MPTRATSSAGRSTDSRDCSDDSTSCETGVRTGPTATLLTFVLEYAKVVAPGPLKRPVYAALGWIVWPLRGLDRWLNRKPDAHVLANSIYALVRKR